MLGYKRARYAVAQLVNILDAVKHSVKLSGRLRKDGTPSNAHGYFKSIKNLCDAIL